MAGITTGISIKSKEEIQTMVEGGRILSHIKDKLEDKINVGTNAAEVEKLASDLIAKSGGRASFKMVPNYCWSTCINVNSGIVHGIPKKEIVFKKGDLVSLDIGLYYKGFHTDSSFSLGLGVDQKTKAFLSAGEEAFKEAESKVVVGGRIYDISQAIESVVTKAGYEPVRALTGHGVGKALHEEPAIPCFTSGEREDTPLIQEGMTLAIEVMYTLGSNKLALEEDGWTISTHDGKISALFEETVAATSGGPLVLTKIPRKVKV